MKSYTDIEQSKKLAEILPLNTADMCWWQIYDTGHTSDYVIKMIPYIFKKDSIPCWSLAALLNVLPLPDLIQDKTNDNELFWQCSVYDEDGNLLCETNDNYPVDVCYEMILKLHELKML